MDTKNIRDFVIGILLEKALYSTNDPFEYAKKRNYIVTYEEMPFYTRAYTYNYSKTGKKEIVINSIYDEISQKFFLAHELGHCRQGHSGKNYYKDNNLEREFQANLFAVCFLCDQEDFNMRFDEMPNYVLETIIEKNVKLKDIYKNRKPFIWFSVL